MTRSEPEPDFCCLEGGETPDAGLPVHVLLEGEPETEALRLECLLQWLTSVASLFLELVLVLRSAASVLC